MNLDSSGKYRRPANKLDREGETYGKLTVLRRLPGNNFWECECECGTVVHVTGQRLSGGKTHCGCVKREGRSGYRPPTQIPALLNDYLIHYKYRRPVEIVQNEPI